MPLDVGKEFQRGHRQLRSARNARAGRGQEGNLRRRATAGPERRPSWHFLTGKQEPIDRARPQAVGFRYVYDEASDQYAHASGIMVLTPAARSPATSTTCTTPAATCGWAWSRRRQTRSARRSTRSCSFASTTTRRPARYGASDHELRARRRRADGGRIAGVFTRLSMRGERRRRGALAAAARPRQRRIDRSTRM